MASLMKCPTCKKSISTEATNCPNCGQPITDEERLEAERQLKNSRRGCLVLIIIFAVGIYVFTTVSDKAKNETSKPSTTSSKQTLTIPTFGMTPDAFVKAFNMNANTPNKSSINIKLLPETEQPSATGKTIQARISSSNSMVIGTDKTTGKITDVTIISAGQKFNVTDASEMLLAWATLIQTFSPDIPADERGKLLREMGLLTDPMNEKGETVRNGVRYWHSAGRGMGVWFGAVAK